MMTGSSLFGRRVHVSGSIDEDLRVASRSEVEKTRELVAGLVLELVKRGATFVVPIDAEKRRESDDLPICFDWLILCTIHANLHLLPADAPTPLVIAVQHHKTEQQIPAEFESLWDELRTSDLIRIENVSHWNMNSKRMEAQARWGDLLIAIGGSEGVLFLANLYHEAGKPVVPLNAEVSSPDSGARRLFSLGLSSAEAPCLFETVEHSADTWINRINFRARQSLTERVSLVTDLLEVLERPRAFVVRLLNAEHEDYSDVQDFFDVVVQPVIEDELGYRITVVDGRQSYDYPRIDQEIFEKLDRSRLVLADITGMRPNCFLELGYAMGRRLPTVLMVREGSQPPFDISTMGMLRWSRSGTAGDRRRAFREHWDAVKNRPPFVPTKSIVS